MAEVLSRETVEGKLDDLEGWSFAQDRLKKDYCFSDFKDAFRFMSSMADYSEKVNHHPDWFNSYQKVNVQLKTHTVDGVTESDLAWARHAEEIVSQLTH